jgi:hypothetical protein
MRHRRGVHKGRRDKRPRIGPVSGDGSGQTNGTAIDCSMVPGRRVVRFPARLNMRGFTAAMHGQMRITF